MRIFYKRESLIQNIAYMAIMAAINVIFVLLSIFLPLLSLLLVLFLPLTSTITTIYCKKRYYPIFFIATLGLCLLVGMGNIFDVIFYVLPSLLTGFAFGLLIEKKVNYIWIILVTTLIQFIISIITIPFMKLISGISYFDTIISMLNLQNNENKLVFAWIFIFFVSFAQMFLSFILIKDEIKKLGIIIENSFKKIDYKILISVEFTSLILTIIFAYFYLELSYIFFLVFALSSGLIIIRSLLLKNKWIYIPVIASIFISLMVFGAIYPHINPNYGGLLMGLYFISMSIPGNIYFLLNIFKQ